MLFGATASFFRTRLIRIHYLVFKDQMPAIIEMAVKKAVSKPQKRLVKYTNLFALVNLFPTLKSNLKSFFQDLQDNRKSIIIIIIFYPCQGENDIFLIKWHADDLQSGRLFATHRQRRGNYNGS
jgi:hypothetical protein